MRLKLPATRAKVEQRDRFLIVPQTATSLLEPKQSPGVWRRWRRRMARKTSGSKVYPGARTAVEPLTWFNGAADLS